MYQQRMCPVCGSSSSDASVFIKKNIDQDRISEFSFASRKEPEYMSHRMVCCKNCALVYVDLPPANEDLAHAYHTAAYDSTEEANDAAESYSYAIAPILDSIKSREYALEIGTGTGIFLEHLKLAGFKCVVGVEPSSAAIEAAPDTRRAWIKHGMFDEAEFDSNSFDLVCCFMTLEHVRDPKLLTEAALRLLRPGGAFVAVTHDYRSPINRLLGRRSPIIDIEHMQIFTEKPIRYLFESTGFKRVSVKSFKNNYSLSYWIKLCPIPHFLKKTITKILVYTGLAKYHLSLDVGNVISCGYRKY